MLENSNYEVKLPYDQAELQEVDDYQAQGEDPSDSVDVPLDEVIESRKTVSPPPTQFFQQGDDGAGSDPDYEPLSKRLGLTVRGRPRGGGRGVQRGLERGRPRNRGGRGVQRGRVRTRGGRTRGCVRRGGRPVRPISPWQYGRRTFSL